MAFKILLTEGGSDMGAAIFNAFENLSLSLACPQVSDGVWCDLESSLAYLKRIRPAVVINTLAHVGGSEGASKALLDACAQLDLTVIHLSSHRVFAEAQRDGEVLSEQDEPQPESDLEVCFLALEEAAANVKRSVIVRIPWLLDAEDGIIFQAAESLLSAEGVVASDTWRGTPVFVEDVVRVVIAIVQQILCGAENWGVFHFHSSDSCSEAEFVDYIARILFRKGCTVGPISVVKKESRLFAGNGWLVGNRCTNAFGVQFRSWRQGTKGRLEFWLDRKFADGVIRLQERALNADSSQPKAL